MTQLERPQAQAAAATVPEGSTRPEGGVSGLPVDRLLETTVEREGDKGPVKHRIVRFDYHHVPQGPYDGEEGDDHFEVRYVPEHECFRYGRGSASNLRPLGLIATRRLYLEWARCLSMTWDKEALTDNEGLDVAARTVLRREGRDLSMKIAARMLAPSVRKVHAVAGAEALRIQRKAFATLGRVPRWAFTPERVADRARRFGWPDPAYAARDFRRLRWFRLALSSNSQGEHNMYQRLRKASGRVRKALAQMPRGISGSVMEGALRQLDQTSKPPSRRLTWIALSMSAGSGDVYGMLAEAVQRASNYEVRKSLKRARALRAAQTPDRSEASFYIHSEAKARDMIHWIGDVNGAEDPSLHCTERTSLSNWVERSGRFHREAAQRRREAQSREVLRESPFQTGYRPQELPANTDALVTPAAVRREGIEMDHCVHSFAGDVVKGRTIILHYEGEQSDATIELRRTNGHWTIGQVQGPDNRKPPACAKGRAAVESWLEDDPTIEPPVMDIGNAPVPRDDRPLRKTLAREQGALETGNDTRERGSGTSLRWKAEPQRTEEQNDGSPDLPF